MAADSWVHMVVIATKAGQLGNRLFLFAHFIACAAENDLTILNPSFDEYAPFFEATKHDLFSRYPRTRTSVPIVRCARHFCFLAVFHVTTWIARLGLTSKVFGYVLLDDEQMFSLDEPKNVERLKASTITAVGGWLFRGESNLHKHANVVRDYFTPLEIHRLHVDTLIRHARSSCDVLVGVHVRRGDYKDFAGGKYYFEVDEYVDIMRQLEGLFPGGRVGYLLCSNEHLDKTRFVGFNVHFGTNHAIEDMYSFAQCDYVIGPPSTYTMWASFYGQVPLYMIENANTTIVLDQFKLV